MSVEPLYFGDRNLFGLYRSPSPTVSPRRHLVVICNATFHEYFKTQFVARQLSKELADLGFDVLRFDFSGQGNSGGDLSSLSWQEDVHAAVIEGTAISGSVHTSLVGLRVGALFAANYDTPLHSIAMWDPLISGKEFVAELRGVQKRLLRAHKNFSSNGHSETENNELVGYRVSDSMLKKLMEIEIDWERLADTRTFIIESEPRLMQMVSEFPENIILTEEQFICQWELPSSRLLFAHGVIRKIVEFMR